MIVNARLIDETNVETMINDPFEESEQYLLVTLAGYRHRFERSMNVKKLRWSLNNLNSTALCDACDLLVPEVIFIKNVVCFENLNFLDATTN